MIFNIFYFPKQNFEKILSIIASSLTTPLTSPKCRQADLISDEIMSKVVESKIERAFSIDFIAKRTQSICLVLVKKNLF